MYWSLISLIEVFGAYESLEILFCVITIVSTDEQDETRIGGRCRGLTGRDVLRYRDNRLKGRDIVGMNDVWFVWRTAPGQRGQVDDVANLPNRRADFPVVGHVKARIVGEFWGREVS